MFIYASPCRRRRRRRRHRHRHPCGCRCRCCRRRRRRRHRCSQRISTRQASNVFNFSPSDDVVACMYVGVQGVVQVRSTV